MLKYSYDTEIYCHLYDLKLLDLDLCSQLVKNQLDLLIYNNMMGRDMNFRYSDISSVFQNVNRFKNIKRIFSSGDEAIPAKIAELKPILHLAMHGLLGMSDPLFKAMPQGMLFIYMLRHPLFLLRQNIWNMENLINNQRSFWLYYKHENKAYPSFYLGRESLFINSNPKEKAIYFIEGFINKQEAKQDIRTNDSYYELDFESLVLEPEKHIRAICEKMGVDQTSKTRKVLKKENIPRKILSDARRRKIYERVGWVKSHSGNRKDEFEEMQKWAFEGISAHAAETLSRLCTGYEEKYGMN